MTRIHSRLVSLGVWGPQASALDLRFTAEVRRPETLRLQVSTLRATL